jgi:hypothetical protein
MSRDILALCFDELTEAHEALDAYMVKVVCPKCYRVLRIHPPMQQKTIEAQCPVCECTFYMGAMYVANLCPHELWAAIDRARQAV